jgi:membrane protease YdiL (CAAX protease family)
MEEQEKRVDEVNQSEVEVMLEPLNYGSNHDEESRIKSPGFGYRLFFSSLILLFLANFTIDFIVDALVGEGNEVTAFAYKNFGTYVVTFSLITVFLFLTKILLPLVKKFTKIRPYIHGLFYGFIVIIISVITTLLMQILFGQAEENLNQQKIYLILSKHPVSSFFWIVLLGPLVEELTYRVGLFNAISSRNRIAAYVVSALVFGFLHFNIPLNADGAIDQAKLIEEFINIPSYIVSGLVFGYIYEKEGFAGSSVAHITNNLISYILSIISIYASK